MEHIIRGIILVAVGCAAAIFRKEFVDASFTFQNRAFGFRFSEKKVRANERFVFLTGVLFIAIGILSLLGIIWD